MTRTLALVLLAGLAAADRAAAQTYIWPGDQVGGAGGVGVSGNWGDPRWRLSTAQGTNVPAPSAADSVSALNGGTTAFTLDVTDGRLIKDVAYNNGFATLRIQAGGSLNASGTFTQSAGALVVNGGLTVGGAFTLNGGTLSGAGSLTLNGAFHWGGGSFGGNVLAANGGSINGGAGNLNITSGSLTYGGAVTWTGGNVTMANGTTFTLSSGAVMTYANSLNPSIQTSGTTGAFVNNGTLIHDTAANASITFGGNLQFTNTGTIRNASGVNNGRVVQIQSVTTTTGVFDTGTGTDNGIITLNGAGATTFNGGASVTGTGEFRIQGTHAVTLNAALLASNLTVGGGSIQGTAAGVMTLSGPLTWNGSASLGGSATLTSPVSSTFSNHVTLNGASLLNLNGAGATHAWNSHDFTLNGTSTVNVGVGATFQTVANQTLRASSGTPALNIAGTFRKQTGTAETTFGTGAVTTVVNNSGSIVVESGTLRFFNAVLNNTGTLSMTSPGILSFDDNGTLNLNAGSAGQGTGRIRLQSSSATVNVNAPTTITGFEINGAGTVQGTQTLTAAGALTITGGVLTQTAILRGTGGGSVGNLTVNTGTLQLAQGVFNWTNDIAYNAGGLIQVDAAATFRMTGDRNLNRTAGSPALTVNGILEKTAGTGNAFIAPGIAVTIGAGGLVDVKSGTLVLQSGATNNGTLRASSGGRLHLDQAVTLAGSGSFTVAGGGNLLVGVTGTQTVPSTMAFTNTGTLQVQSGTFNIASTNLTNLSGTTLTGGTWQVGNGTLSFNARPVATIAAGTVVEINSGGAFTGLNALTQNNGQFRIASGATHTIAGTVSTTNVLEVSGTLGGFVTVQSGGTLAGRGTVNGNVTVQSGAILSPGPGPFTALGTGQLSLATTNLNGGSDYIWELNTWAASPIAGSGFDQIRGGTPGAKLNLAGASDTNRVTLRIVSLNGALPGLIAGFDPAESRSWVIADYANGNATGGVQNFAANKFNLDTFLFGNEPGSAQFSLSLDANANRIILTYTPVPEPAAVMLVAASALCLRRLRRR